MKILTGDLAAGGVIVAVSGWSRTVNDLNEQPVHGVTSVG